MKRFVYHFIFLSFFCCSVTAQEKSFMILGDVHYDLADSHDEDWLKSKPDDVRQVKEYTTITQSIWPTFSKHLYDVVNEYEPKIESVIQLGDLSEGLAGSKEKAEQMAKNTVKGVEAVNMPVPWIIVKGNHDITGPGAVEAFNKHYISMFQKELNRKDITSANYSHQIGDNLFVVMDPWDKRDDLIQWLDETLSASNAKFKFLLVHEPVVPISERCWHLYRNDTEKRDSLLKVIAKNHAIVFAAHLHLFAIVKRETPYGPILQVSVNSVVRDLKATSGKKVNTQFGSQLAVNKPNWQPKTLPQRIKMLDEESQYVTFFKQMDLPGYGILTTNPQNDDIFFEYYTALGSKPYERVCLSDLLKE